MEHGSEPKKKYIDQIADWIIEMMDNAQIKYNGKYMEKMFFNNINFDKGSQTSPKRVRDYIMHRIREKFGISLRQKKWTNKNVCTIISMLHNIIKI